MVYRGIPNWPPVWTQTTAKATKILKGELGTLNRTVMHDLMSHRCFLLIEHEKENYMGCLMFDDATFCKQIHQLLQFYVGCSIEEIGNIDLSFTL